MRPWPGRWLCLMGVVGCWSQPSPLENARRRLAQGEYEQAGQVFFRLAKEDPANLAAWDGAVRVRCRLKVHIGKCLEVLDLELDRLGTIERHQDALSKALLLRAQARLEQGLARAALDDLKRAEKASPRKIDLLALSVRANAMLGLREPAEQALAELMGLAPDRAELSELRSLLPTPTTEGFGGN